MVFLFSLINISFSLFFFLFWQYIESVLFWILFLFCLFYFSKILSLFIEKESLGEDLQDYTTQEQKISFRHILLDFLKKGSYYIAFLFFYTSLFGIMYSTNLVYNFSQFSEIFHTITLVLSGSIMGIFFFFLQKKQETVFLLFRSNCIVFTLIYSVFLLVFLIEGTSPGILFIINSILPLITLFSVLVYDSFFTQNKKYIYLLFLLYIFLIGGYYFSLLFSHTPLWDVFLVVLTLCTVLFTLVFPSIPFFRPFSRLSQEVGVQLSYILSFSAFSFLFILPFSFLYLSIIGISLLYHYTLYTETKNLVSYIMFLLSIILLYIKSFLFFWGISLPAFLLFIFLLPYIYIGYHYIVPKSSPWELYILHSLGIGFSILAFLFYWMERGFNLDILSFSLFLFFESILLFLSYVGIKK